MFKIGVGVQHQLPINSKRSKKSGPVNLQEMLKQRHSGKKVSPIDSILLSDDRYCRFRRF